MYVLDSSVLIEIIIAGICAALNATLVTTDQDFTRIDGLKVRLVS